MDEDSASGGDVGDTPRPASSLARWIDRLFFGRTATVSRIRALDGLRGIAVLLVLLSHMGNAHLNPVPGFSFAGTGRYGVYLFFVLSAFLLTLPMLERLSREPPSLRPWVNYALRRFLRIYPLYAVVLVACAALHASGAMWAIPVTPGGVFQHLGLRAGEGIFWAIPVEFKYYLALPFVALAMIAILRASLPLVLAVGAAAALGLQVFVWPPSTIANQTLSLGPFLPIFVCGSLAAFVHWHLAQRGGVLSPRARRGLDVACLAVCVAVLLLFPTCWRRLVEPGVKLNHFHNQMLLFGALWGVFVVCALNGSGWIARFLSLKPLRFVGIVSFSVYLWHQLILDLFVLHVEIGSRPKAALIVVLTFLVCPVSYLLIERPFLHLGLRPLRPPSSR